MSHLLNEVKYISSLVLGKICLFLLDLQLEYISKSQKAFIFAYPVGKKNVLATIGLDVLVFIK